MIVEFSVHDTEAYSVEQLLTSPENNELIKDFKVGENAYGLERYLKEVAQKDEDNNFSRTYLVKDRTTGKVASYFSSRLPPKQEKFVQYHVKPKYDEGCIFMYQIL